MKFSLSVLVTVFLLCFAASAAATIVEVTTRDETSDGPSRHPRRTLNGKKNRPATVAPTQGVFGNPDDWCHRDIPGLGDVCYDNWGKDATPTESDCKGRKDATGTNMGCYWFPHGSYHGSCIGKCWSTAGVSCGTTHRATTCERCPYYDTIDHGKHYCHGDCEWKHEYWPWADCHLI